MEISYYKPWLGDLPGMEYVQATAKGRPMPIHSLEIDDKTGAMTIHVANFVHSRHPVAAHKSTTSHLDDILAVLTDSLIPYEVHLSSIRVANADKLAAAKALMFDERTRQSIEDGRGYRQAKASDPKEIRSACVDVGSLNSHALRIEASTSSYPTRSREL